MSTPIAPLKEKLIADSEAYCARAGISMARLATLVVNDGKFFIRIGRGKDFTVRTYERFQAFFAAAQASDAGDVA